MIRSHYILCAIIALCLSSGAQAQYIDARPGVDTSQMWVINTTTYPVVVKSQGKYLENVYFSATLQPGDSVAGPTEELMNFFLNPSEHYTIWADAVKDKKGRNPVVYFLSDAPDPRSELRRRFYFVVKQVD